MNYAFLLAGGVAAFGLVLHLLLGRARPPFPRAGAGDPALPIDAALGRHASSLILAAMAITFANAARQPGAADAALVVVMLGGLIAVLRAALAWRAGLPNRDVAEWGLMALSALLGGLGLLF